MKLWLSVLIGFASIYLSAVAADGSRKPNIVVILGDDQGYADVSFNPHHPKEVSTPNIDGEWSVRSGNWKLVASPQRSELFDLAADPSEKTDLATMHPEEVRS